ncbi:ferritin [Brachionus plicatilis]|uniref:Ferritin n=1 Tax=Brachionus plicatilis TaxID=10195 RepID=A0A3M7P6Q9_BRAPC|nr:ferritin [Brachionus plicatilis]
MHTVRTSLVKQNLHPDSEKYLNECINAFLYGAYNCKSMAYYFDRDDIGMFGMANFNKWCSAKGFNDAKLIMDHITVRGGNVVFEEIKKPERDEWGTPLDSLEQLLSYKLCLYKCVNKCHRSAHETHDPHLNHFLETVILRPLVVLIRRVGVLIANLKRAGSGLGEYQLNKDLECYLEELKYVLPVQASSFSRINRRWKSKVVEEEESSSESSSSESEDEDDTSRLSVRSIVPALRNIADQLD